MSLRCDFTVKTDSDLTPSRSELEVQMFPEHTPHVISPAETWEADRGWRKLSSSSSSRIQRREKKAGTKSDVTSCKMGKKHNKQNFCGGRDSTPWQMLSTAHKRGGNNGLKAHKKTKARRIHCTKKRWEGRKKKNKTKIKIYIHKNVIFTSC